MRRIPLTDGGEIDWGTDWPDLVPIGDGDRLVPTRFWYDHPGGEHQPAIHLEFGVEDRIPVCTKIVLTGKPGAPVRSKFLKMVKPDVIVIAAVEAAAVAPNPHGSGYWRPWGGRDFDVDSRSAAESALASRPRATRGVYRKRETVDLEQVAKVWNDTPRGDRYPTLMATFFCSKSTAARYVKRAREAGLIDE